MVGYDRTNIQKLCPLAPLHTCAGMHTQLWTHTHTHRREKTEVPKVPDLEELPVTTCVCAEMWVYVCVPRLLQTETDRSKSEELLEPRDADSLNHYREELMIPEATAGETRDAQVYGPAISQ